MRLPHIIKKKLANWLQDELKEVYTKKCSPLCKALKTIPKQKNDSITLQSHIEVPYYELAVLGAYNLALDKIKTKLANEVVKGINVNRVLEPQDVYRFEAEVNLIKPK